MDLWPWGERKAEGQRAVKVEGPGSAHLDSDCIRDLALGADDVRSPAYDQEPFEELL